MDLSLLFSRLVYTLAIILVGWLALRNVWTKKVTLLGWLEAPGKQIPVREERVSVTPETLNLTTRDWDKTQLVEVRNNAATSVYSVWLKLWAENGEFNPDELQIASPSGEPLFNESMTDITVNFDLVRFTANDAKKRPCIFVLVSRLEASASRLFKVARPAGLGPLKLSVSVRAFQEKPPVLAKQRDQIAMSFNPPAALDIKKMTFRMSRQE